MFSANQQSAGGGGGGYEAMEDDDSLTTRRVGGAAGASALRKHETLDTSGDEALALALANEQSAAGGPPVRGTERDEELALALAMAYEEEENREEGQRERQSSSLAPPPPPPRTDIAPPQRPNVDIASAAHSMFERIMSTFRGGKSATPAERSEAKKSREARIKARLTRQATVVLNTMEVAVPDFISTENYLIMKPDGTVSKVHVPIPLQQPPFHVPFEGEPLVRSIPIILDEVEQGSAFVDYYRFSPIEIETEVDVIPGPRPLGGLELISQEEGVFVRWGVFPLPPSPPANRDHDDYDYENDDGASVGEDHFQEIDILETQNLVCAGDLIVQVGDTPTSSLEQLRMQLAAIPLGSNLQVRVLRKPPPVVRCPMGHMLHLDDSRATLGAECDSCRAHFGRHHCVTCGFSLCWPCFQVIYNHSKARFPRPVNNDHEFTEAPRSTRVTFSEADVGAKVLIYWYTTAEWWIGQVESFDEHKGHTVVYEERNGEKCREIIPDFSVREYRILSHCILGDDESEAVKPFHSATLGHPAHHRTSFVSAQVGSALLPDSPGSDFLSSSNAMEEEKSEIPPNQPQYQDLLSSNPAPVKDEPVNLGTLDASLNDAFVQAPLIQPNIETETLAPQVESTQEKEAPADTVILDEAESAFLKGILGDEGPGGADEEEQNGGEGPP